MALHELRCPVCGRTQFMAALLIDHLRREHRWRAGKAYDEAGAQLRERRERIAAEAQEKEARRR